MMCEDKFIAEYFDVFYKINNETGCLICGATFCF